ncbi:MAG TPA: CocE/NonD family hydrolase [Mycobacteriales bacterium]|nr:CocE/NonD family hydrolase [Mycobacteriales bacterium]
MRRKPLLASVVVTAVAMGVAPAAAIARPHHAAAYTKTTLRFHVTVPNETPDGTGTQTCLIVGDLYKPAGASATNRVPVILTTNGFGGSKNDQADLGVAASKRGYGVLSYSGLGFGGSGCKISLDDPSYDGVAGSQLISFLGGQTGIASTLSGAPYPAVKWIVHDRTDHAGAHDRFDPRVGMIGGSYGGGIQFAVAKVDPRLDTIVPIITWNDLRYSLSPNNATTPGQVADVAGDPDTPGTEKLEWSLLLFADGLVDGITGIRADVTRDDGCVDYLFDICPFAAESIVNAAFTQGVLHFLAHASVGTYVNKIRIPTLLMQGQGDSLFNLREAAATYKELRAQGTPVKMVWQSWGHSVSTPAPGEFSEGTAIGNTYEGQRVLAWFAHYLKGEDVSTGPAFAYYRDYVPFHGKGPDTVQYATASHFPIGTMKTYYASAGGSLMTARSDVLAGTAEYANLAGPTPLSYSEVSGLQGTALPDASTPPFDLPGTAVGWTSAPLSHHLDVAGIPAVTLHVQTPVSSDAVAATELQLFVKVYDVAPNGDLTLVHRLVAPVRVANDDAPVHVLLPGIVHRFAKGDRIELAVAATDTAYRNADLVQPALISTSKSAPVTLKLPVVKD